MAESMWNIPDPQNITGPVQIMRQQGDLLSSMTGGRLKGTIQATSSGEEIISQFNIIVPSLGYYSYTLCAYAQSPLIIYPGRFFSSFTGSWYNISDEEHFIGVLQEFLGSAKSKDLIKSLLSQTE